MWAKKLQEVNEFVGKIVFKEEDIDELLSVYWNEMSRTYLNLTAFDGIREKGFKYGENDRGLKFDETLKKFALLPYEKGDIKEEKKRANTFNLALMLALKEKKEA